MAYRNHSIYRAFDTPEMTTVISRFHQAFQSQKTQQPHNFPFHKFPIISLPVTLVVAHSVGKSNVLLKVSAYPKNSIGGIQPRAYSSAKHASRILYCLTSPRLR